MQTERVTFLTTPANKAMLASRAAAQGISIGEYIRRKVEEEDEMTMAEEAELATLVRQANEAIPSMRASLDRMSETLREAHETVDKALREAGIRK